MRKCLPLEWVRKRKAGWKDKPWITIFLIALIWGVHIAVRFVGSPVGVERAFGINPGQYHTYITYAFIHAHLTHLIGNTISLLLFGIAAEQQVRRLHYLSVISISVLVGGVCGQHFPYPDTVDFSKPIVGISAAGWALEVLGVGLLVRHWNRVNVWRWYVVIIYCIFPILDPMEPTSTESITPVFNMSASAIYVLAICLAVYPWVVRPPLPRQIRPFSSMLMRKPHCIPQPYWAIPSSLMLIPLTELLRAQGAHPGELGHLAGALIGLFFLFLLRNRIVPKKTPTLLTWIDAVVDWIKRAWQKALRAPSA